MQKSYLHNIKSGLDAGYRIAIIDAENDSLLLKSHDYNEIRSVVESNDIVKIVWQDVDTDKKVADFLVADDWTRENEKTIISFQGNRIAKNWYNGYLKQ